MAEEQSEGYERLFVDDLEFSTMDLELTKEYCESLIEILNLTKSPYIKLKVPILKSRDSIVEQDTEKREWQKVKSNANIRKQEIVKRLMDLGLEMSNQKNYGTSDILFGITKDTRCFSFFEKDIDNQLYHRDYDYDKKNTKYCYSIHNAHKMNLLRELLIQLSKENRK
jgi:hypothetical protein